LEIHFHSLTFFKVEKTKGFDPSNSYTRRHGVCVCEGGMGGRSPPMQFWPLFQISRSAELF